MNLMACLALTFSLAVNIANRTNKQMNVALNSEGSSIKFLWRTVVVIFCYKQVV